MITINRLTMSNQLERRTVCTVYDDLTSPPKESYPAAPFSHPAPDRVAREHESAVTTPSETIIGMINLDSQTHSQWRVPALPSMSVLQSQAT
jgi:hypothetical protein